MGKVHGWMIVSFCQSCCEMFYPRRDVCPSCGSRNLDDQTVSGKGDVYSYTVIHEPPTTFEGEAPYVVALVHLIEGAYVTAQLRDVDLATIFIGMPLEAVMESGKAMAFRPRLCLVE